MDERISSLKGGRLIVAALIAGALLLVLSRLLVNFYVELLWFDEVGYQSVYWTRLAWIWGTRVAAGLLVGLALFFNLRYASRTLGGIQIKRQFGNLEISEQLPESYVLWAMLGISALLGLWFGASVTDDAGIHLLLTMQGLDWGVTEPFLGKDLSFYVFLLPLLRVGVTFLLIVLFLVFSVCTAGYAATGSLSWDKDGVELGGQARLHLGGLIGIFMLTLAARFWLGRYLLLQYGNSDVQGIFGYADFTARLPALRTLAALTVLGAVAVLYGTWKNRLLPAVSGVGAVVLGGLVISQFYPSLVQRFQVQPNELERESRFIEHNLEYTRMGFALDEVKEEPYAYEEPEPGSVDWDFAREQFSGLPVWTSGTLLRTFRSLEARRPYYDFGTVDIDRYDSPTGRQAVAVSVREIDPAGIQDPNWQNLHIRERYISGMGAVAADASERSAEARPPMFLTAIPPELSDRPGTPPGLDLPRPGIFIGTRPQNYAVVNPSESTFLAPDSSRGVPGVDYPEGIQLSSLVRSFALAWYFRDANLLFADEISDSSRFIMRRQVVERVQRIFPFLSYPETPYPVIEDGRVVWILEGFTVTRGFPLARAHELQFRSPVTYVRNSVKITVDAATGEVDFYALPEDDPFLDAYAGAFPGLLQPFDEMPEGLQAHIRYSREFLNLQSSVLLQYHQDTAPEFHGQQDVWARPMELSQTTSPVPYQPEYGLYRMPGDEEPHFYLTTVFVPEGRPNLTAIMAGKLDPDGRRSLVVYDVPDQVQGPRQVEALVEQDPTISQQFSLWRTGGSQVWTGHLHVVPVGDHLLYMEPVFLAAEADAIPELRRFVVSDGRSVAMESSLVDAVAALAGDGEAAVEEEAVEGVARELPLDRSRWPAEALELLDRAESRLRAGDWVGFGRALDELRGVLVSLSVEGGG